MDLSVQFRERLMAIGDEVLAAEFDNVYSKVLSGWSVEHTSADQHGDVHATTLSERGRSVPLGEWIDVPYNSSHYTASGGMTWTVDAADLITFSYMLWGKTMFVAGIWDSTTVAAPLSTTLQVLIPGGYVAAKRMQNGVIAFDNGVGVAAYNRVQAGGTVIEIGRADAANWAAAVNNTFARIHFAFAIR